MSSKTLSVFTIAILMFCSILGYGYWHSVTHASLHVDIRLLSVPGAAAQTMPLAKISFQDESGHFLAAGISDEKSNFVHLLHPDVGDCHEAEKAATTSNKSRTAWQECFDELSTWIPQWVKDVHMAEVIYKGHRIEKIPVAISANNSEWFLWWVPLPHVGGKPYTYYRATISVDTSGDHNYFE